MQRILIIGATSAIAEATARLFAVEGAHLFLVARNRERLAAIADDLRLRGAAGVETAELEVTDFARHAEVLERAWAVLGEVDGVLVAHGTLPDQRACEASVELTLRELEINGSSVIALLTLIAQRMEEAGKGVIAAISSPAGDRGRQSNYVYGSAKAMVSQFLSGLRNRLTKRGVHVVTVKPGFVDTPMTREFKKGFLWSRPEVVAQGIKKAMERRKNQVYLPWFWWGIMLIIRAIPEPLFKRLGL